MRSDTWIVHPKIQPQDCTMSQLWPSWRGHQQYVHTYCITFPAGVDWSRDADRSLAASNFKKLWKHVSFQSTQRLSSVVATDSSIDSTCVTPCTVTCYLQKARYCTSFWFQGLLLSKLKGAVWQAVGILKTERPCRHFFKNISHGKKHKTWQVNASNMNILKKLTN